VLLKHRRPGYPECDLFERWGVARGRRGRSDEAHQGIRGGKPLLGRAILDVWTLPDLFHGTTLRIYDPAIDAWHVVRSDSLRQFYNRQMGRAQGRDIVQVGKSSDGADTR
jgi:hypothetical protein